MEQDGDYKIFSEIFDGTSTEHKIEALEQRNDYLRDNRKNLISKGEMKPADIFQELEDNKKKQAEMRLQIHMENLEYWMETDPDHHQVEYHSRKIAEQIKLLGHRPGKLEREGVICWILKKSDISSIKIFELLDGGSISQDAIYKRIKRWSDKGAVFVRTEPWLEYLYQDEAEKLINQ